MVKKDSQKSKDTSVISNSQLLSLTRRSVYKTNNKLYDVQKRREKESLCPQLNVQKNSAQKTKKIRTELVWRNEKKTYLLRVSVLQSGNVKATHSLKLSTGLAKGNLWRRQVLPFWDFKLLDKLCIVFDHEKPMNLRSAATMDCLFRVWNFFGHQVWTQYPSRFKHSISDVDSTSFFKACITSILFSLL